MTTVAETLMRYPELENMDIEVFSPLRGAWVTIRVSEVLVVRDVVATEGAVATMLAGGYANVMMDGREWQVRLTPKSWKEKASG